MRGKRKERARWRLKQIDVERKRLTAWVLEEGRRKAERGRAWGRNRDKQGGNEQWTEEKKATNKIGTEVIKLQFF